MTKKEKIIELCMGTWSDYWNLPMYGLIPDWQVRYWELHEAILDYFDETEEGGLTSG